MTAFSSSFPYLLRALLTSVELSLVAVAGSFSLGTLLALLRLSEIRWLRMAASTYVFIMRTIPLLDVIFWMFFALPLFFGHNMPPLIAAATALILYEASYMAEVVRAGITVVPKGVLEAARSSGMSARQRARYITLPLSLRAMQPALLTQFKAAIMGTSIVYVVGVTEFFGAASEVNNRIFQPIPVFASVAAVYFAMCYSITLLARAANRRAVGSALHPSGRDA
jgi:His/Glu/Gln/Arg/opine family amino acid ABC transporter permease subunit